MVMGFKGKVSSQIKEDCLYPFYSTDFPQKSPEGFRRFLCSVSPVKTPLLYLCTYRKRLFLDPSNLACIKLREGETLLSKVFQ